MAVNFYNPYISNNYRIVPNLATVGQTQEVLPVVEDQTKTPASFADFLSEAVSNTISTDAGSKLTDLGLMTGTSEDIHSNHRGGEG